jgi:hypothetical protein
MMANMLVYLRNWWKITKRNQNIRVYQHYMRDGRLVCGNITVSQLLYVCENINENEKTQKLSSQNKNKDRFSLFWWVIVFGTEIYITPLFIFRFCQVSALKMFFFLRITRTYSRDSNLFPRLFCDVETYLNCKLLIQINIDCWLESNGDEGTLRMKTHH